MWLRLILAVSLSAASGWAATDGGVLCLDRSFADGGLFVRDVGGVRNVGYTAQQLSLQGDGKLVLGGMAGVSPRFDFVTLRLLDDGSLDPTFGDGGLAEYELGGFDHNLETVEVQPDGRIIIAGALEEVLLPDGGTVTSTVVAQLLPDGQLDPTFGTLGVLHPRYGAGFQLVNAQVRLPDGRHRLAGQCRPFSSPGAINLCVIGLLTDGSADPAFGDAGFVELDIDRSDDFGGMLVLDAQGRLLVPSTSYNGDFASSSFGFNFGLARLLANGEYDPTFTNDAGVRGRVTTDFFARRDACNAVLVQPDGLIVCAGDADTADGGVRFAVARYLASGELDSSFGDAGRLAFDFGADEGPERSCGCRTAPWSWVALPATSPVTWTSSRRSSTTWVRSTFASGGRASSAWMSPAAATTSSTPFAWTRAVASCSPERLPEHVLDHRAERRRTGRREKLANEFQPR